MYFDGSHLKLFLPEGNDHDVWTTGNRSARLLQTAQNTDFEVEVQFDVRLSPAYSMQGILVEQDEQNFLRFDFNALETGLRIFAASFVDGVPTTRLLKPIAYDGVLYMRIKREGDEWTQRYSYDRQEWHVAKTFVHPMEVTAIGPFAGNAGGCPTITASIDYFFNLASPLHPEDNVTALPPPPQLQATPIAMSKVRLEWTDPSDLEDSFILEKRQVGEEFTKIATVGANRTEFCDTFENHFGGWYQYRVAASNVVGVTDFSNPVDVTLPTTPVLSFFYGETQTFGLRGIPQRYVNILGDVSDTEIVDKVMFRLNNAPEESLRIGSDRKRLAHAGDFNIELETQQLNPGQNMLTVRAVTNENTTSQKTAEIFWQPGAASQSFYSIRWDTVAAIQHIAQIVDGHWKIDRESLRTVEVGFDRLVAIGDTLWKDYQVTVPVTVHNFYDRSGEGSGPGVGLIARWRGHTGDEVPRLGHPYGILAWYRKHSDTSIGYRLSLYKNGDYIAADDLSGRTLTLRTTYMFKLKAETQANHITEYKFKVWPQNSPEPGTWDLSAAVTGPESGSVLLVAHKCDVSFGDVAIENITLTSVKESVVVADDAAPVEPYFYPNPFNNTTFAKITLHRAQRIQLCIYNLMGELLVECVDDEFSPGTHMLSWNGQNAQQTDVASGVYLYRLNVGAQRYRGRLMVVR